MDIFLAICVLFAVLLLGVLISIGNERQRKAIDGLREQAERWAEQDIRIKREKLAREIIVPEPLVWLEKVAAAALGSKQNLLTVTPWQKDGLSAIVGSCPDGRTLVFTPVPRNRLLKTLRTKSKDALAGVQTALLGHDPNHTPFTELSIVTNGMFFDVEAAQVWQAITGESLPVPRLTMYEVPAPGMGKRRT